MGWSTPTGWARFPSLVFALRGEKFEISDVMVLAMLGGRGVVWSIAPFIRSCDVRGVTCHWARGLRSFSSCHTGTCMLRVNKGEGE